jgi:hypothetical protein
VAYRLLQVSDFDAAELARIDLSGITSHDAAVEHIQRHSLGWSWSHQRAFSDLGVTCRTVIPASETVRRLSRYRSTEAENAPPAGLTPAQAYVQAVARAERPAVIFLDNPTFLDRQAIDLLRADPRPPLLVTHFCAALPAEAEANLALYDLVLCCSPHFVAVAEARRARAQLHYHAAPPAALELPLPALETRLRRACFIGSIVAGSRYHGRRLRLLRRICQAGVPIDIYSHPPRSRLLTTVGKIRGGDSLLMAALTALETTFTAGSPVRRVLKPPVYGQAMFDTLQRHICAVNVHAGMAQGWAANMRLFEAAALGVCLISEDHPNLGDLFEPGREILTYRTGRELIARIHDCIERPEEACAIGERARQRALAAHCYAHRVEALHGQLLRLLEQRR